MTFWTLIRRSLRHYARAHLGVVLGAAVGSAALIGALIVGDSVRGTLRQRALARLGDAWYAIHTGDRTMPADYPRRLNPLAPASPGRESSYSPATAGMASILPSSGDPVALALTLPGIASKTDGAARANRVQVIGVASDWPTFARWVEYPLSSALLHAQGDHHAWGGEDAVLINETLARQLSVRAGDDLLLRVPKPTVLGLDAALSPRDEDAIALHLKVRAVLPPERLGDFALTTGQTPPANLFLPLDRLGQATGWTNRINLVLFGPIVAQPPPRSFDRLRTKWATWLRAHAPRITTTLPGGMSLVSSNPHSFLARLARQIEPRLLKPVDPPTSLAWLTAMLRQHWDLDDAGLKVRELDQPPSATGGQLAPRQIEIATSRVFLESVVATAALQPRTNQLSHHFGLAGDGPADLVQAAFVTNGVRMLTYLANQIRAGDRATPYSMVTAAEGPYLHLTPGLDGEAGPAWPDHAVKKAAPDLRDDEILVNEWLANDLKVKPGDAVQLTYFVPDSGSRLTERTNSFRVRAIVPLAGRWADRTLMPDFPGVAKAESTRDWDTGFPLTYKIREQDEAYWKTYRGTPKAFVTLAAGQKMWANRFGSLTAIRYAVPPGAQGLAYQGIVSRNLLANLDPAQLGLRVEPVRLRALAAADQAQDFGQLFLGFSFFLVVAALLLMALLFQFGLEQRVAEVGTLLALGFTPKQLRRLLLGEGAALALAGGCLGTLGGLGYAKAMLWALATLWHEAVGSAPLAFYVTAPTLVIGLLASTVVGVLTLWFTLRQQGRQPIARLLTSGAGLLDTPSHPRPGLRSMAFWVGLGSGAGALALCGWAVAAGGPDAAETFFSAGSLCLIAGLAFSADWLKRVTRAVRPALTLSSLGLRACARRLNRSLATITLLACGTFLTTSIGVFRLDAAKDAAAHRSGTGGFALLGQSTLPVTQDLNTTAGRDALALDAATFTDVNVVSFRVHEGDEASCLNLNRAQQPRLLGVKSESLAGRFTFSTAAKGWDVGKAWKLLAPSVAPSMASAAPAAQGSDPGMITSATTEDPIPAVGDANSIQWALGKAMGDTLDYTDESGRKFQVKLVGAVANSILQGGLIIDEAAFVKRFPSAGGYRMLLIDAPAKNVPQVSATLSRALQDSGLEVASTADRLNAFNAVQNTYLDTFQILGGLGLLLGSAGLGVVVLRNVLERRGELGLLVAVGFRPTALHRLILGEHSVLLGLGLGIGVLAAAVAVLPALLSPGAQAPWHSLVPTLALVLGNGLLWAWVATRVALRGNLLAALRNE